jgi:hypothetical protein
VTDLIDRIDALVDEQMADGEPENGYDFDDPDFPECPHCGRDWHGLRLTRRIQTMRRFGHFDPEYSYAEDDSPVLCEGSDFIGPRRPPQLRRQISFKVNVELFNAAVFTRLAERIAATRPYFEAFRASAERLAADAQILRGRMHPCEVVPVFAPRRMNRGFIGGIVVFDELYDERDNLPEPGPLPDITVEFGPQNWHYELQRKRSDQYWVPVSRWQPPLIWEVRNRWREFTAPDFPVPSRPGYDFTRYVPADEPTVWAAPPSAARHHTRPPATARRAPRRGRTRR